MQVNSIKAVIEMVKGKLEEEIKGAFEVAPDGLDLLCRYQMGFCNQSGEPQEMVKGKLVRPIICLVVCEALGGNVDKLIPAAAGIEIIHRTSLVFDDIQDNGRERNQRPTTWAIWGQDQAINAGLTLSCCGRLVLQRLYDNGFSGETVLRIQKVLEIAVLDLCSGQFKDIEFSKNGRALPLESYIDMVDGKTAALFRAACQVGAIGAGSFEEEARQLGTDLGILFQMHDDFLGVWGDEAVGKTANDLVEKKLSLPVVLALEKDPGVKDLIGQPDKLFRWLNDHNIQQDVILLESQYRSRSEYWLSLLPHNAATSYLHEIITFFMSRDR